MTELFEKCDIISVHVNLNEQNHYLISSKQFNIMKKGSYFINTSRGQLVKSEDLIEALEMGYLKGAATDVIENEFNHKEDILVKYASTHNNLIITPHIGGNTYESFEKTELFMVEKLKYLVTNIK
jgi:D-3-phosphoglycerate dehydrogenase